jgi:hypothetical protein
MNYQSHQTKQMRTAMALAQMSNQKCQMTAQTAATSQKDNSIPWPATFQSLTASLRGGVLISFSRFTLTVGLPQCLVRETTCTVPVQVGQILGKSGSAGLLKYPVVQLKHRHSVVRRTSLRGAATTTLKLLKRMLVTISTFLLCNNFACVS